MAKSATDLQEREAILREHSELLGIAWAQAWVRRLRDEGRMVHGGWPGTLQEARSHVDSHFSRELCQRGLAPLSYAELVATTNASYARARREWHRSAAEHDRSQGRRS